MSTKPRVSEAARTSRPGRTVEINVKDFEAIEVGDGVEIQLLPSVGKGRRRRLRVIDPKGRYVAHLRRKRT